MRIKDFIDDELKQFSNQDNIRSIPKLIDGLKDSQRKCIYGLLQHGTSEIKVSQLSAKVALNVHYAHGEASLNGTIVGLAQKYPGANNVNLFEPIGQFGSILSDEAASPRYIFTKPSTNLTEYFKKEDNCILEYRYEDGDRCEPYEYYPSVPMWALNGSVGIGTGYSVKIFPRHPERVKKTIRALIADPNIKLNGKKIQKWLKPYFDGWSGEVIQTKPGTFEFHGQIEKINTTTLQVTELPIGYDVDRFKKILVKLIEDGKVKDFDNNSTENGFDFQIKCPRSIAIKSIDQLKKLFKLITTNTENITLWDDGKLVSFDNFGQALKRFVDLKLGLVDKRRLKLIELLQDENEKLSHKMRFIREWNQLKDAGRLSIDQLKQHMTGRQVDKKYHDEFLRMKISSLSMDRIEILKNQLDEVNTKKEMLENTTSVQLYLEDL